MNHSRVGQSHDGFSQDSFEFLLKVFRASLLAGVHVVVVIIVIIIIVVVIVVVLKCEKTADNKFVHKVMRRLTMQARLQVKKRIDVYQVVVVVDVDHEGEGGYQEAEETEQVERV